ncbi:MAG: hypothetical protein DRQ03_07885, partial [Candidatus Hydrothermota bacterium]
MDKSFGTSSFKTTSSISNNVENKYLNQFSLEKVTEIYKKLEENPDLEYYFLDKDKNPVKVLEIKKVPYSGRIYDVDVENDIVLVRRAGIPVWSGNSNTKAVDISKYGNNGTIHGATWTTGKFDSALKFDGTDDYVNCGNDSSLNITDAITIEVWVKPTGNNTDRSIIEMGKSWRLSLYNSSIANFQVHDGGEWSGIYENISNLGKNWIDLGAVSNTNEVLSMTYLDNGIALFGGCSGGRVHRSTDYGLNWTAIGDVFGSPSDSMAYCGDGIVLISFINGKVWRSTDYGLNWTDLGTIGEATSMAPVEYLDNGIALLGDDSGHVYRSTDYGENWTDLGIIDSGGVTSLAYLESGIAILGTGGGKVHRSTDYGENWTEIGTIATDTIRVIAYLGNGIVILGDDYSHVHRSTDYGLNWTDLGTVGSSVILSMAYLGNGVVILGNGDNHVYRSTNYGLNWTDLGSPSNQSIESMAYLGSGIAILGDNNYHVFRSKINLSASITPDTFSHITGTFSENTTSIYVNGVLQGMSNNASRNNILNNLLIGKQLNGSYFNGLIDEVRIYNRALTPEEIRMHYLSEFQKFNATEWRFYNNVTNLTDGTYTYYGLANDTVGNEGQTETRTLTVDTTPPAISITYPTSNSVKNNYIINGTST